MSIPRRDKTTGPKDLTKAAQKFREAGQAYWDMCCKTGLSDGAVTWVQFSDGALCVFTRGEYSDQILAALRRIEGPHNEFSWAGEQGQELPQ